MKSLDAFYEQLDEPIGSCLHALRTAILNYDEEMSEALKYSMPFFSYRKKMICYFWIDKKQEMPYIGFIHGHKINLPWLVAGDRSRIKIMYIDPYEDIPVRNIRKAIKASIDVLPSKTA